MLKKILGVLILLVGVVILGWIGYNYFVEMQPEAKGQNPLPALLFSSAAIYVGSKWIAGKK